MSNPQKTTLLMLPLLLVPSTALVFTFAAKWLGKESGYLLGFVFYWVFWCLLVPLSILKSESSLTLFKEKKRLFQKSNWLPATLLVVIIAVTVAMYPPTRLSAAPIKLLILVIPTAIINGICEELLWRGLYIKVFPENPALGIIYPSIGFALWHICPQLVFPAETGITPFVLSTFFLGISYAWISYRTGSIKWNVISHSLGGILDLGGAIAPSIMALLFQ